MIKPVDLSDDAHPADGKLREVFQQHVRRDCTLCGWVRVVCIDAGTDYRPGPTGTMVPRANNKGGILGLATEADRKYGEGVTRRVISCHMDTIKAVEGFRPDTGEKLEPQEYKLSPPPQKECKEPSDKELEVRRRKARLELEAPTEGSRITDVVRWLVESVELDLYEKNIKDKDLKDFELRVPRNFWDLAQKSKWEDFMGYPMMQGVAGEVSLCHKRTGITRIVKWKD